MNLTSQLMMSGLASLDNKLTFPVRLIVGGGGALLLAHHFSLSTTDIDAVPASGVSASELEPFIKEVAMELGLPVDWINPYFSSFTHVLPQDYGSRLVSVGTFKMLTVQALSKEDLLIMKCFAARQKDIVHARALVRMKANLDIVKNQIELLTKKRVPGCEKARKFLSEIEAFFKAQDDEK